MLGLEFSCCPANIDESMNPALPVENEVARVSAAKAAAAQAPADGLVVAADTIVVLDGIILGKPRDTEDAKRMLRALSGRSHSVLTGLTVRQGARSLTQVEKTQVCFRPLSEAEIDAYVAEGGCLDKAGAYGIQGHAALFCERLEGDYYNVMGLPLCTLGQMLARFGVRVLEGERTT